MKTFVSIQHLRGLAALMVVAFHALQPAHGIAFPAWTPTSGAAGVDIFFVISGFIIYVSTEPGAGAVDAAGFIRRRLTRILPLYWLFTLLLIGLHLTVKLNADLSLQPSHILQSLLLIPHFNPSAPDRIEPMLVAGWTLSYEMFFYLLFAMALVIAPARRGALAGVVLVALVGVGLFLHPHQPVAASFTNPRLLEFMAGLALGAAAGRRRAMFPAWGWIGVPLGLAALVATDWGPAILREAWGWGPLAALVVWGALCLDVSGRALKVPGLKLLGDASYSIYLSHLITLGVARQAFRLIARTEAPWTFPAFLILAFAASTLVGIAAYRLVEMPLLAWLNGRRRRAPASPALFAQPSEAAS